MKKLLISLLFAMAFPPLWVFPANNFRLTSPNGKLTAVVKVVNGKLVYDLSSDGNTVLASSSLAMRLSDGKTLGEQVKNPKVKFANRKFRIKTPIYRCASVNEACNVMTVDCGKYAVEFEAFNGGMAYRFVTHYRDSVVVADENDDFALPGNDSIYCLPSGFGSSFEGCYEHKALADIDRESLLAPQLLVQLACGKRLLFADYDVQDYPGMFLKVDGSGRGLHSVFAGYPKKEEETGTDGTRLKVTERENYIARVAGTRTFPWRFVLVADDDAALLTTNVPCCLAAPNRVADVSWIKPGKASWEWWNACNLKGVDFRTGVNNDTYKYYIDFASRNGIEYILMDAGWTKSQHPLDLLKTIDAVNIPELVEYARQRNVGIVLWADYHPFDQNMEAVVSTYSKMGIKGFKIDHINRNDQKAIDFAWRAASMCAKYHMIIDFHGVFPPNGLQFTYTNVLNFEAVLGLETVKWTKKYDGVTHECTVPFIRQVVGPIDYTQGAMRNATQSNYAPCNSSPMSQGTRCRQLAEYVIFESPFNMLCDSPINYEANQPCTDFIAKVPTVWDETRVLSARVGEYVIEARRKGGVWYIGGITNWASRDITLDLSFIKADKIVLYRDGVNADRNAEDYCVENLPFNGSLKVHLAPGGGFAGIIK